jgi:enoyl-CoA hydratase/carnithine racemase
MALEMLLTGRMISAQQAGDYGLVNKVVPGDQLAAETIALKAKSSVNGEKSGTKNDRLSNTKSHSFERR